MMLEMAAALAMVAGQAAPAPVLTPSGKWVVHADEQGCLLMRSFGGAAGPTLVLRPLTGGENVKLLLLTADPAKRDASGKVTFAAMPGSGPVEHVYETMLDATGQKRITALRLKRFDLKPLDGAQMITFHAEDQPELRLAVPGLDKARAALDQCEQLLMKSWGFDPATIATPPRPVASPGQWVTNDDYPTSALRRGDGGDVAFRLTIDPTGKPIACTVTVSGGAGDLDRRACALLMKRARFHPATDATGKPVQGLWATNFRWMI
jgi:TonB family protein